MSMLRRSGVAVVVLLLVLTLLTGNVVVAGHRTVLDPGFVKSSLTDERVYDTIHDRVFEEGPVPFPGNESPPPLARDVPARIVTAGYLRNQTERNVDRAYAYLHGERREPGVAVNLTPAVERADEAIAATVRNTSVQKLVSAVGVDDLAPADAPVNTSTMLMLTEGPESYERARERFRDSVRERAIDRIVNRTYDRLSNDERLRVVGEDPRQYTEEEKERFVRRNEAEIKAALRERIVAERGDEIDRRVNETLDSVRGDLKESAASPDTGTSDAVDEATGDLLAVMIDGLAAEDLGYRKFRARLDDAKADLGAALGDYVQSELESRLVRQEGIDDRGRISLTGELPPEMREQLSTARTIVRVLDFLVIVLVVAALGLVGVLWLLTSGATAALWTGVAAVIGGLPVFLGAEIGGAGIERFVTANTASDGIGGVVSELVLALVDRVLGTVAAQSLALAVGGGLLAGAGAAVRLGVVDDDLMGAIRPGGRSGTAAEGDEGPGDPVEAGETGGTEAADNGDETR